MASLGGRGGAGRHLGNSPVTTRQRRGSETERVGDGAVARSTSLQAPQ